MKFFKSETEKLAVRLAELEASAAAAEEMASAALVEGAEASEKLVADLAEGLPVADWQAKQDAAEARAAKASRTAEAHRTAAVLVAKKLEDARHHESVARLLASLEKLRTANDKAQSGLRKATPAFIEALAAVADVETRAGLVASSLLALKIPSANQAPGGWHHVEATPVELALKQACLATYAEINLRPMHVTILTPVLPLFVEGTATNPE